jgi:hypothetical protein
MNSKRRASAKATLSKVKPRLKPNTAIVAPLRRKPSPARGSAIADACGRGRRPQDRDDRGHGPRAGSASAAAKISETCGAAVRFLHAEPAGCCQGAAGPQSESDGGGDALLASRQPVGAPAAIRSTVPSSMPPSSCEPRELDCAGNFPAPYHGCSADIGATTLQGRGSRACQQDGAHGLSVAGQGWHLFSGAGACHYGYGTGLIKSYPANFR